MSSRKRKKQLRGPSRPIDPRRAPGGPPRRGPDTFGIGLIAVSAVVALILFLFIAGQNASTPTTTTVVNPTAAVPTPVADATQQEIAFLTASVGTPRIGIQDAIALNQANNAKFFDTRPKTEFPHKHIKGAISLPPDEVASRLSEIPKTGNVILYCQ
jgi:hypothetical protein